MANGPRLRLIIVMLLAAAAVAGVPAGADTDTAHGEPIAAAPLEQRRLAALSEALHGRWVTPLNGDKIWLDFYSDRTFTLAELSGRYVLDATTLTLAFDPQPGEEAGGIVQYNWAIKPTGELELTGGDLSGPLVFTRQLVVSHYVLDLLDISPAWVWERLVRIGFILSIVIVSRLLIAMLHLVSHWLIFSNWGPLRLLFRRNKNRARTVHSLVLNLVKYFIYFTALGMVLSELGVNYATYFASLSVIGLAIGFGSQGLVQDMVTGFFIIFEGQFDVGDMVEISGQAGIVQELGLRMTKIRNYMGQVVVIPNRNIVLVANYSRGAQRGYVDVPITGQEAAEQARATLLRLLHQVARQFDGVVLPPLRVTGPTVLETGETYLRVHLSIWPSQTWVVDQQLLPRIREQFAAAGLAIPSDRIAVHYHAREKVRARRWSMRMPWQGGDDDAPDQTEKPRD